MQKYKTEKSFWILFVLYLSSIFIQSYFVTREEFIPLISLIGFEFILFLALLQFDSKDYSKKLLVVSLILHVIPLCSLPSLSNDFYRFLWDGEILHLGINPFDFKPNELINRESFQTSYFQQLFIGMGDLSQENYSCYPVFNQAYFYVSTLFSNKLLINVIILRILILSSLIIGFKYLVKLLEITQLNSHKIWILVLNPLLIIEVSQNLHFEGVMLSLFCVGIYFLTQKKLLKAGLFLSLAIQIKLIPLILIPFILRYLNWKNSLITWTITGAFTILFTLILVYPSNYQNFLASIVLYFRQFEFNSFILHYYIEYGRMKYGYNRIQTFGPYLSRLATEAIIILAWIGNNFTLQKMFQRMFFAMMVYFFLSGTVHPWYILTPLLLGVFTKYKVAVIWSACIFLSYYSYANLSQEYFRNIVGIEYLVVFLWFFGELIYFNYRKLMLSLGFEN